jgi:RimJ/RimL family protein N-acetyltransferase
MEPVVLRTERLLLDQPVASDVDTIAEYCRDPLFEEFLTTPWPYTRQHAEGFVDRMVPAGWASGSEATWAIRAHEDGPLLGVIAIRTARNDVGFWLGADERGNGYMQEALGAVAQWAFTGGVIAQTDSIAWEAIAGNVASAAVARGAGFTFTGTSPAAAPARDGAHPTSWHGVLLRSNNLAQARESWPAETRA